MSEIWKPVVGFESHYLVSSLGRVQTIKTGRILKNTIHNDGYEVVGLYRSRTTKIKRVNILVCEAFHGSKPFESAKALHSDDNKLNNTSDNLYWGTDKQNTADRIKHGIGVKFAEQHPNSKLTWDEVHEMRKKAQAGATQNQLMAEYWISQPLCSKILLNQLWKDPNYVR